LTSKPIIQRIKLSKEQQEKADNLKQGIATPTKKLVTNKAGHTYEFTSNRVFSRMVAKKRLTAIYGGPCCVCGNWPDYKVLYDVDNAKRVERYCQTCYSKYEQSIKEMDTYNKFGVKK
jgi:hypothetical protein